MSYFLNSYGEIDEVEDIIKKPKRDKDECYTPPHIVSAVKSCFYGQIDLDPASNALANTVVGAKKFYTKEQDGLFLPWTGNIFCNPPYSKKLLKKFVNAIVATHRESEDGGSTQLLVLVNNATETQWFHTLLKYSNAFCLFNKRLQFWGDSDSGLEKENNRQGQVMFFFSKVLYAELRFHSAFEHLGTICHSYKNN